jgi:hypothetical protein
MLNPLRSYSRSRQLGSLGVFGGDLSGDLAVSFQSSGTGINAQSLGVPPPDCGKDSAPVIGSDGNWTCGASSATSTAASPWLVVAALGGLWFYFYGRKKFSLSSLRSIV